MRVMQQATSAMQSIVEQAVEAKRQRRLASAKIPSSAILRDACTPWVIAVNVLLMTMPYYGMSEEY